MSLSAAQERFILDPRPYVKGPLTHPAVRTMMSLKRKGLLTFELVWCTGANAYEYKLTDAGKQELQRLSR